MASNYSNDPFGRSGADEHSPMAASAPAQAARPTGAPAEPAPATNDPFGRSGADEHSPSAQAPAIHQVVPQVAAPAEAIAVTSDNPLSASLVRFNSCRWQQPKEEGTSPFCTHREVKPYAGTTAFDADAWCPECQYYKLRRTPKKRSPSDDYTY